MSVCYRQVQKIAFLDMYTMNTDRNDANIMVKRRGSAMKLIPIDHGYCLPDCFEINELSWCWLDWKQTHQAWDPRIVAFAEKMDVQADVRLLNECLGMRKICLVLLKSCLVRAMSPRISGVLLKKGIHRGLTPAELASFYVRKDVNQEQPCMLERIVQQTVERVKGYIAAKEACGGNEEYVLSSAGVWA